MPDIFRTSQSKVKTYRKCHYAYYLRYKKRLRPKVKKRPLKFGEIVHLLQEARINGGDPFAVLKKLAKEQGKTFKALQEEYGDLLEDIRVIYTDYLDYYKDRKKDEIKPFLINGKASEITFEVEVAKGIVATGKIDQIAQARGGLWVNESKTGGSIPKDRWKQMQSAIYIRVIEIAKVCKKPVDGTLWDFIRSKPPSAPQILKNGEPTRRQLDTIPTKVAEWLKEHNQPTKKFSSLIKGAYENRSRYFERIFMPANKDVIDELWADFIDTSEQIKNNPDVRDRHIGRHCDWCEFKDICEAELQGLDVAFVRKTQYEISNYQRDEDEEADIEV